MYNCEVCKNSIGPKISRQTIVIATREKVYPARPSANDPGGQGREIAKEIHTCPQCVDSVRPKGTWGVEAEVLTSRNS